MAAWQDIAAKEVAAELSDAAEEDEEVQYRLLLNRAESVHWSTYIWPLKYLSSEMFILFSV